MSQELVGRRNALRLTGLAAAGAVGGVGIGMLNGTAVRAAPVLYNPITPYRSVDTRAFGPSGMLSSGFFDDWDVWTDLNGAGMIPQTAAAVTYNLTVTGTVNSGWLTITPARQPTDVSSINWMTSGFTLANGGTVQLGASPVTGAGSVSVGCGGTSASTHYIIDITGYFA